MMKFRLREKYQALYVMILLMIGFIVVAATGGGLFGQSGPWYQQWQHQAFRMICHQLPDRSFWIGGQPMAVCSRDFGVFVGMAAGWLVFLPVMHVVPKVKTTAGILLVAAVVVNLGDVIGNLANFWQNTLASRFLLGSMLGLGVTFVLGRHFITVHRKIKGNNYGTTRTVQQ